MNWKWMLLALLLFILTVLFINLYQWVNEPDPSEYMRHYKRVGY